MGAVVIGDGGHARSLKALVRREWFPAERGVHVAIGDNATRKAASEGLELAYAQDPSALVLGRVAPGVQVFANAYIGPGAVVGRGTIVNTGAIVEHDCVVGEFCHVAVGAVLCGGVTLGDCVWVGANASVRQGITIGEGAVVGMGAAVVKDVPPHTTVMGVPAK